MSLDGTLRVGTVQEAESTLGYIAPDTGEEVAALLPSACAAFNSTIPPVGTRVVYRQTRAQHDDGSEEALAAEVLPEDHDFHGTVEKDSGSFGFIQIDGKEDQVFVMPIACSAFGGQIPPLQTPVKFKVVMDHKTGRPRADFVRPQFGVKGGKGSVKSSPAPAPAVENAVPGGVYIGQVTRVKGNFGFIQPDDGAEEVFFMPRGCKGFHGPPAPGMRVSFEMVNDEKTGRPRADHIFPEAAQGETSPAELLGSNMTGTICDPGDKFGFITQDDGSSMFVLPGSCSAFGMVIPPAGTRVLYDVVADPKTGRPRAENVQPSDSGGLVTALKGKEKGGVIPARNQSWSQQDVGTGDATGTGVISRICNGYGFIDKEDGESMFVLPTSCKAFAGAGGYAELPPVGTPVDYDIVMDSKTGRPRAENVRPAMRDGVFVGTISKSGPQFGFITQDTQDGSEVEMFVLPLSCGGQIPPVGTRVTYTVVEDSKTGRPRAENVMMLGLRQAAPAGPVMQAPPAQSMSYHGMEMAMAMSGSIIQAGPTYGFIQPDDGGDKMFVLPGSCTACGDVAIPPVGTRVTYYETIDQKTGKPRADQVQLEAAQWASESAGKIIECGTRYGFIKQDNGENMFVMPAACAAFGSVIPPVGTRVTFRVVPDGKTGRPRAEDVCPEKAPASYGKGARSGKTIRSWPSAKAGPY